MAMFNVFHFECVCVCFALFFKSSSKMSDSLRLWDTYQDTDKSGSIYHLSEYSLKDIPIQFYITYVKDITPQVYTTYINGHRKQESKTFSHHWTLHLML